MGVLQATDPFHVSHYRAEWVTGSDKWDLPIYPGGEECRQNLRDYYRPWREVQAKGVPVHIGEFGCHNKLPNDIALRWLSDLLSVYREFGWGYSLWNFRGSFGIVEHGRPGAIYEEMRGMNIDRALLELLKENRV